MPRREVAAKRYAEAIFNIAQSDNTFDQWRTDLAAIRALYAETTVAEFLQSTKVEEPRKFGIIDQALADSSAKARSFAKVLVRKQRVRIVDQIEDAFTELFNAQQGITVARVTTAVPLDDAGRAAIESAIRRRTSANQVQLEEVVDRDILGGAVVRIGDRIIDGSLRTRLTGLKRSIAGSIG